MPYLSKKRAPPGGGADFIDVVDHRLSATCAGAVGCRTGIATIAGVCTYIAGGRSCRCIGAGATRSGVYVTGGLAGGGSLYSIAVVVATVSGLVGLIYIGRFVAAAVCRLVRLT